MRPSGAPIDSQGRPQSLGDDPELAQRLAQVAELAHTGQHDAAMAACDDLLHAHPRSAEVRAAMGDIYAARQLWPEAAEWYGLAVEMGAGPDIGRRLDHAHAQARAQRRLTRPPDADDLAPAGRRPFGGPAALMGAVLLLLVFGLILLFTSQGSRAQRTRAPDAVPKRALTTAPEARSQFAPSVTSGQWQMGPMTPATQPSSNPPATGLVGAQTTDVTEGPTVARAPVVVTNKVQGPVSDRDLYLAQAIGSLNWPDGRPMQRGISVAMDPFTGYALITFDIPSGLDPNQMQRIVTEQAYKVGVAALRADPGLGSLTLRGLIALRGSDRQTQTLMAFRANLLRTTVEQWRQMHGTEPTAEEIWSELFGTPWWDPSLNAQAAG